jgi:hypothetical protein
LSLVRIFFLLPSGTFESVSQSVSLISLSNISTWLPIPLGQVSPLSSLDPLLALPTLSFDPHFIVFISQRGEGHSTLSALPLLLSSPRLRFRFYPTP